MILRTLLRSRDRLAFLAGLFVVGLLAGNAQAQTVVGRITDVEGQLYLFVQAQNNWVPTVKDAPFGLSDSLYTNPDSRAEIVMPNNVVLRLGPSSQVQLATAKPALAEFVETAGVARFSNQNSTAPVNVTTPYGVIEASPGATFDVYVGDQSMEVLALAGSVNFIHAKDRTPYRIVPGATSLIANAVEVGPGSGTVDPAWAAWNQGLDRLWAQRAAAASASVQYLPKPLRRDAYELDKNGRWERVLYKGREVMLWRPTDVPNGWAPFSTGRWVEWNGDTTWVPAESFGYVTHHYGNWVNVNDTWYWQPPRPTGPEPSWYPGRVAWVGSGEEVGWVPLAPEEPYYAHRQWGPEAVVVATGAAVVATAITIAALSNANRAIVVPQRDFYGVDSYARYRDRRVDRDRLEHHFRPAPVINNTVVNVSTTNINRYSFTSNAAPAPKPVAPKPPVAPAVGQKPGGGAPGLPTTAGGKQLPPKPIPQEPTQVVPVAAGAKPAALTSPRPTPGGAPTAGAQPQGTPGAQKPGAPAVTPGTPTAPGKPAPAAPGQPAATTPGHPGTPVATPQPSGLVGPRATPGGAPVSGAMPQGAAGAQKPGAPAVTPGTPTAPGKPAPAAPGQPAATTPGHPGTPVATPQPSGLVGPRATPGGAPVSGAMPQGAAGVQKPGAPAVTPGTPAAPGKTAPTAPGQPAATMPGHPGTPGTATQPSGLTSPRPTQGGAPASTAMPQGAAGMQKPGTPTTTPGTPTMPGHPGTSGLTSPATRPTGATPTQTPSQMGAPGILRPQQAGQTPPQSPQANPQQLQQQVDQRRAQEQARQQQQQQQQMEQQRMQDQARQQQQQQQMEQQRRMQEQARQQQQQQQMEQQRRMQEQARQQQQQQQMEQQRMQDQARQQQQQQQMEQQRRMQEQARQQQQQQQMEQQRRMQEQARQQQQQQQPGNAQRPNCQQNPNDPRCK